MDERDITIVQKMLRYINELESTIKEYKNDFNAFLTNSTCRNAICMCLLQIGELSGKLSEESKLTNPDIEWRLIKGMRNIFAHAYSTLDPNAAWNSATKDVPKLKISLQNMEKDFVKNNIKYWPLQDTYNFYSMRRINLNRSTESDPFKCNFKLLCDMLDTGLSTEDAFKAIGQSPSLDTKSSYRDFVDKSLYILSLNSQYKDIVAKFNKEVLKDNENIR